MARDYYAILGVEHDATDAEIKKAYRRLARKYHPDVNPSEEAAAKFSEASLAQEILTDPEKRRIVDAGGDPQDPGYGRGGGGGFNAGGFGDIFDAFFGGGASTGGPRASRVRPGNDALLRMTLTLEECFTGVQHEVTVDTAVLCDACEGTGSASKSDPDTCPTCQGQGQVMEIQQSILGRVQVARACPRCQGTGEIIPDPCEECAGDGRVKDRRDIPVNIPAGIRDGMRIRMSGKGEVGPGGGPAGDLYVEVRVEEHPCFVREEDDLHVTVHVPMVDAALGTAVDVTMLDGSTATVTVDPGTQPEAVVRIKGAGMPHLRRDGAGHLIAHVDVTVPTELDRRSRELLEELRDRSGEAAGVRTAESEHAGGLFSRLRGKFGR
ncbi:molecular chaperone DnaJ [Corynebacterium terpenotabidum]|uniref:Chaperone protein DnaJ n=1 Tax=Corynebacterium terpenotabidum Y-11 TaxID=1200352 RepID=S4XBJ8_9CORY|nr:molecular chaperone DnaJ [Corynebacterium terpenotabidum]AGP30477.1 hypothetical protein A606_04140 [Corynebacterium terpenotabidum Y-11]